LIEEVWGQMGNSTQIAEALDSMWAASLAGTDREGKAQRSLFIRLLHQAREQSRLITSLSTKLRLVPQATTRARDVAREQGTDRGRPAAVEPVIVGGASDDDDGDDGAGSATN
jgi:hypothetical protein